MNRTLKDRARIISIQFVLIISMLLSFCMNESLAQENQTAFDYTKTVWIINVIDDSGTVYGRPRAEEYNPRQGFICIYEILIKYVYNMQNFNSSIPPNSLTATHELILINSQAEQRLLLGDHWISDERNIAVMSEVDYNNLKEWLGTREKNQDYKKNPPLDALVRGMRDLTSPDTPRFDKYFNRTHISSDSLKTQRSAQQPSESLGKNIQTDPERESGQATNQNKTEILVKPQHSITDTQIKSRFDAHSLSMSSISSSAFKAQEKTEHAKFSLSFYLAIFIASLLLLFSLRYWKNRKR